MSRSLLNSLRIATALVVFCGFVALATTDAFPGIIILIPLILFAITPTCEQLDRDYPAYRVFTSIPNILFIPIVFAAPFFLGLLNAVIMLVVYIQIYLLIHRKRERDYYYLYLMAFFLLVAACVLSPEATIGLVMLVFLVSSIWAFLILQIYLESERNQQAATPDLLALHEQDGQVIAPSPQWLDASIVLPVTGLCAVSIVLTVTLFIITPRMEAGFLGRRDSGQFTTGLGNNVDISTSGEIQLDPTLVLRAEFPDEPGGLYQGEFFWRCAGYNSYTDRRWIRRQLAENFDDQMPRPAYRRPIDPETPVEVLLRNPSRGGRIVRQVVYVDQVPEEGLPCLSTVTRLEYVPPNKSTRIAWEEDNDGSLRLMAARPTSITYEAWSEVEDAVQPSTLRAARDGYQRAINNRDYTILTRQDLTPAAQNLARQITEDRDSVYDKVKALENWFQSEAFTYSLVIPSLDTGHPIDDFILNRRIGHCQLYATAMALMLRSLGIPCRVVTGYRGAEWVDSESAYVVRADMAHLWVEVYFLDLGWFSFDPSPPLDRELTGFDRVTRRASLLALRAKMLWFSEVVGFSGIRLSQLRDLSIPWFGSAGEPGASASAVGGRRPMLPGLILVLPLWVIVVLVWVARRRKMARRIRLTLDQLRAQRLFFMLRRKLQRLGTSADGKTAEELLEEIVTKHPPATHAAAALHVYNEARFGGRVLTPDQFGRLKQALRLWKPRRPMPS